MKRVVYLIFLCLMMYSVSALGVARPFFSDNTMEMDANETAEITFQLQNMADVEERMIFRLESQHTMEIDGSQDYENQFTLDPFELRDVSVEFYAEDEGLYRIDYSYSDVCSSGDGICLNSEVGDSFFIQVGDGDTYWAFEIPLDYNGYKLNTESRSISSVDDLMIATDDGLISVDFTGEIVDLTGFLEQYVSFGTRRIAISGFSGLNKPAVITMYQVESNYKIQKDGVDCSASACKVISYSNKRLKFETLGFSTYEVVYVQNTTGGNSGSSGSSSSSGGTIITTKNTTVKNMTNLSAVEPKIPESEPELEPEPEPEFIQEPVQKVNLSNRPSPFINAQAQANNSKKVDAGLITLSVEGKSLLIRSVLLGVGALFLGGLLFYYIRKD